MIAVRVQGGTGAGSRVVKARPLWACRCNTKPVIGGKTAAVLKLQPGEAYSCPDCGARRPA